MREWSSPDVFVNVSVSGNPRVQPRAALRGCWHGRVMSTCIWCAGVSNSRPRGPRGGARRAARSPRAATPSLPRSASGMPLCRALLGRQRACVSASSPAWCISKGGTCAAICLRAGASSQPGVIRAPSAERERARRRACVRVSRGYARDCPAATRPSRTRACTPHVTLMPRGRWQWCRLPSLTGRAGGADARCGVKAEEGESNHGGGWASRPNSWGKQKKD